MVAFVTMPVIETVGVGLIDLEKPAVIVTTSERASKLSSALCVRVASGPDVSKVKVILSVPE